MSLFDLHDFVAETSTSTGTGDFVLQGAVPGGHRRFVDTVGVGNPTYYTIWHTTLPEREVGQGTLTAPGTLRRDSVLSSTNGNALVAFSPGDKIVFIDVPAAVMNELARNITWTHTQGASAAVWTITHNLDRYPSVTVVDSAGTLVHGALEYLSANVLRLTFSAPFSGKAYLN